MRLTLRTLLAYLDDTLDASQVKQIGQKVAESDTAQELIARIKQVTRRRRLTTPPSTGPGSHLDANTIAEYLENKLSEDQVAEVEQVSLGSDVHLAELAACHQLLTLIQGEPVLVPPTSRQRMYGLVKGREAIPFRKPRVEGVAEEVKTSEEHYQMDETLRMGLPAWRQRSSWASRLTLVGGTLAACLLLVLAIWQALRPPDLDGGPGTGQQVAAGDGQLPPAGENGLLAPAPKPKEPTAPVDNGDKKNGNGKKTPGPEVKPQPPDNGKTKPEDKTKPGVEDPKKPGNGTTDPKPKTEDPKTDPEPKPAEPKLKKIPLEPPAKEVREAGKYERNFSPGEADGLLQKNLGEEKWKQVGVLNQKIYTGATLVSLPGYLSQISLGGDALQLKLHGTLPEEMAVPVLSREAMVELHSHDQIDLDLTLHRGKITITNRKDKPAQVRLRFGHPAENEPDEVWDVLLDGKGTEIFVERNTAIEPGDPFFAEGEHKNRKGPIAQVYLVVREGKAELYREHDKTLRHLQKPPGEALFYWVSTQKPGTQKLENIPEFARDVTDYPEPVIPDDAKPDMKKQLQEFQIKFKDLRLKMKEARKNLAGELQVNSDKIGTVFKSMAVSENYPERILAVRCYGAVDQVESLADALATKDLVDVRRTAIDTLRRWISYEWDHDFKLFNVLREQAQYTTGEASDLITMLHGFSAKDALTSVAVYETLIPRLNDRKLALRELAALHLYLELQRHFPETIGLNIEYSPDAPEEVRLNAVQQWQDLLKSGKLPPQAK